MAFPTATGPDPGHSAGLGVAERDQPGSIVDEIERVTGELRADGRAIAGIDGTVDKRPLRELLRSENASLYPAFALFALSVSDLLHGVAFGTLSPDIGRTFGLGPQFFSVIGVLSQVLSFVVPLTVARLTQNRAWRATIVLVTAGFWCVLTGGTALVTVPVLLVLMMMLDTATSAANSTVSSPLMVDLYPPRVRVRVLSALTVAGMGAGLVAPALIALLTGPLDLNWRGVFLVVGALALVFFLLSTRLRDPGYGKWDTERIRARARQRLGVGSTAISPAHLTIFEALRRIVLIRSMRLMLVGGMVGGLASPVGIYLSFYYASHFNLDATARALLQVGGGLVALVSFLSLAPLGDRLFQRSPKLIFYITGAASLVGLVLSSAQVFVDSVGVLVVLSLAGVALSGLNGPAMTLGVLSLVPAQLRPHVAAVQALFMLAGTTAGTILLGGLVNSLGLAAAVVIVAIPRVAAIVLGMVAGKYVRDDLDRGIEEVIEEVVVDRIQSSGRPLPALVCRGIDYSYGQTQVLFGVDFTVDDGETVALLGVNGAGKSTLLRAISGLGLPQRGSIRFDGHDITYIDAERRAARGIVQVPGGQAVFGDLTVVENLRCYGYTLGRKKHLVDRAIEQSFATFPRLAERRNERAVLLSGGEQQMLGLTKAIILKPRLLLIDELSLGLAPVIVDQLLGIVRQINAAGTAVVLVEQSVNVALSVAEHAYFMEKGEIRFDGASRDLLARPELLRAVFLNGVAGGGVS